jgi:hypothetical protein
MELFLLNSLILQNEIDFGLDPQCPYSGPLKRRSGAKPQLPDTRACMTWKIGCPSRSVCPMAIMRKKKFSGIGWHASHQKKGFLAGTRATNVNPENDICHIFGHRL